MPVVCPMHQAKPFSMAHFRQYEGRPIHYLNYVLAFLCIGCAVYSEVANCSTRVVFQKTLKTGIIGGIADTHCISVVSRPHVRGFLGFPNTSTPAPSACCKRSRVVLSSPASSCVQRKRPNEQLRPLRGLANKPTPLCVSFLGQNLHALQSLGNEGSEFLGESCSSVEGCEKEGVSLKVNDTDTTETTSNRENSQSIPTPQKQEEAKANVGRERRDWHTKREQAMMVRTTRLYSIHCGIR